MNMKDRPSGMKREPTFSDITSVSLPELDADAPPGAAKQEEAQQILYEWAKVATYWMSRREVAAMLRARADDLG